MQEIQAELHDNKAFAMLHDASAIRGTQWEGMTAEASFAYLSGLMNLRDPLMSLGLSAKSLALVRNAFEDFIEFAKLFKSFPETPDGIVVDYKQCIALLHARAAMKNGIAYMPSGWIGLSGHFVAVKLQLIERNVFAVSYLQQGAGTQFHRPMIQCEYKTKYCYQSDPVLIDFDTELGENFLLGTVTLNFDKRIVTSQIGGKWQVKSYSEVDLYALLQLSGTPQPGFVPDSRQAVTLQRVGSCALTNAKVVANDVLIFLCDYSAKKIKRYTFGLKTNSLQVAIDAYAEGKCDEKLLVWALREANVRINKHYPEHITVNECLVANQLIQSVKIRSRVLEQPFPELFEHIKEESLPMMRPSVVNDNKKKSSHRSRSVEKIYTHQLHPTILPQMIAQAITTAAQDLFANTNLAFRLEVSKFLRSLPKTSGLPDDQFWDQVSLEHQKQVLKQLLQILQSNYTGKEAIDVYALEAALIVYDIAAQLAIKHPELKFDNQYALGFSDVIPKSFQFYEPEIYFNVKHIIVNFQNRCLGKKVFFTNDIIGYDYEDQTFLYIKEKLLTPERRRLIIDLLIKNGTLKPGVETEKVPDELLIPTALTDLPNASKIFGNCYSVILQISALAHCLGGATHKRVYSSKQMPGQNNTHFHFNDKSQLSNAMKIRAGMASDAYATLFSHLPQVLNTKKADFYDFAENTIAHPLRDLRRLNAREEKQNEFAFAPYQYRYGGTFQHGGILWPKAVKNLRLEALDEEFRRIEATGNMSVVVLLEWLLTHMGELEIFAIRQRVAELLFSFGHLDYALTSHTGETLRLLSEFLHVALYQSIDNLRHDDVDSDQIRVFQFLCDLHFAVAKYIAIAGGLYNINMESFRAVDLRQILMQELDRCKEVSLRKRYAELLICSFIDRPPEDRVDFYCILRSKLIIQLDAAEVTLNNNQTVPRLSAVAYEVWQSRYPGLVRSLSELPENELSALVERALGGVLLLQENSAWEIHHDVIRCSDQDLQISLGTGNIYFNSQRMFDRTAALRLLPLVMSLPFDHENTEFFDLPSRDNPNEIITVTADRRWTFFRKINSVNITQIYRNLNIDDVSSSFLLLNGSGDKLDYSLVESYFLGRSLINPFGNSYIYALSAGQQLFVQSLTSPNNGYLYTQQSGWLWVQQNNAGDWQTTGYRRLDFYNPQLTLERAWRSICDQSIGYISLRALARLEPNSTLVIESLSWVHFRLSFKNSKGVLLCDQHPGYFWRQLKRLPSLSRINTLIILENKHGECKYLLPPFLLKKVKLIGKNPNKALSAEDFISTHETLDYPHCFEYELDRYGELCGTTDAANLYLAIIYRCSGDYNRAMAALKRSESLVCNTALQVSIAKLTMSWPDLSALGAAFDCQLMLRLYRHAFKWSKEKDHALTDGKDLLGYCLGQLGGYFQNFSTRKKGICIIPQYMRLRADELALLGQINEEAKEKEAQYSNAYLLPLYPIDKIEELNKLFQYHDWSFEFQFRFNLASLGLIQYSKQALPYAFSIRVYESNAVQDPEAAGVPGYEYLLRYFVNFFEDALSTDKHVEMRLRARLFMLANNDIQKQSQRLIFLLLVVMNNKRMFKSIGNHTTTMNCIRAILVRGTSESVTLRNRHIPLTLKSVNLGGMVSTEDALITAVKCQFSMSRFKTKPVHQYPYPVLAKKYLFEASTPVATDSIMDSLMVGGSKIEYRLMAHYYEGNVLNRTLRKTVFQWLNAELTLADLRSELVKSCADDYLLLQKLNDEILQLANSTHKFKHTAEEVYFHSARRGEQRSAIGMPELFQALLNQDHSNLLKMNPFLQQAHLDLLMSYLVEYTLVQIRIDQAEAITQLKFKDLQKLGRLLTSQRHYNVVDYPEFLVYEYATKRLLRLDQVESLISLIKLIEEDEMNVEKIRHALLQFAAGGGKTAVIIPILVQRFARKGFMPVIINTNELYSIAIHEIPKNLRFAFNINVEVIERELEHQWTLDELIRLNNDLTLWRADRKCLLMKPITWHSINIASTMGYERKYIELAQAAEKVLDFFYDCTVMLEDEGHVTSDPLQQSIKTHGERLTVSIEQQQLIVGIYQYLLGIAPDSKAIAELAGIIYKSKTEHSDEELTTLQGMLVNRMITFTAFRGHDLVAIKKYFLQPEKTKPQWLHELRASDPSQASLIVLGRAFVKTLLPHILTLQHNTDYGRSIHPGDLTAAPMREGKNVTSHFADQMLVLSLTIQLYFITGIPEKNLGALLTLFKQQHTKQLQYIKAGMTPAERLLNTILPRSVGYVSLTKLSKQRSSEICANPEVRNSFYVLKEYLFNIVFQQISTPKYRVESTAADFQAGFRRRITFSATPGLQELYYPTLNKEHYHELLSFEAEVLATLLREKNSEACLIDMTHDPRNFFLQIKTDYPEIFRAMQALIDRGALVSDLDPEVVTAALMELFDENDLRDATMHFEQGDMFIKAKQKKLDGAKASGTNVAALLKQRGIKPESLLLFLFLDLSKTTGTDVVRPINDCAAITIGKGQTLSGTIQAAMRERQLLEENAQTLKWIIFRDLYSKISPEDPQFDLRGICYWMITNDAKELENKVINRAYQVVNHVLVAEAKAYIRKNPRHYEKIRHVFHQQQVLDPYLLYEIESVQEPPKKVLEDSAARLWKDLRLGPFHKLSPSNAILLGTAVNETDALIHLMTTPHGAELNAQVCQEQMQVVQQLQELEFNNLVNLGQDFVFSLEVYQDKFDSLQKIFGFRSQYAPMQLKIEGLRHNIPFPKILIKLAHFHPYAFIRESTYLVYIKPFQALLVARLEKNAPLQIVGCTSAGIQYFADQIKRVNFKDKSCYALIGRNGHILCASSNMDIEAKLSFEQDETLRDAIVFSALLDGEVKNIDLLVELVKKYRWSQQDFTALINTITALHISRTMVTLQNIPDLAERCGWKEASAPLPLNNLPHRLEENPLALRDYPLLPRAPSTRWSPARLNYQPHSILSGVLFGQPPRSSIDLPVDDLAQANRYNDQHGH